MLPLTEAVAGSPFFTSTSSPHKKVAYTWSAQPTNASANEARLSSEQPWLSRESKSTQMPVSPVARPSSGSGSNALALPDVRFKNWMPSDAVRAASYKTCSFWHM